MNPPESDKSGVVCGVLDLRQVTPHAGARAAGPIPALRVSDVRETQAVCLAPPLGTALGI